MSAKPLIETMVVVSGPSAAGKSTFIRQLMNGTLAADILATIPDQAGNWPLVDGNDIMKQQKSATDVLPKGGIIPGIVVHYDFVHILRINFAGTYRDDPFYELFDLSKRIVICDIRPTRSRLVDQFEQRLAQQKKRRGLLKNSFRALIHNPMRSLKNRLSGVSHENKQELYNSEQWLDECYARWDEFLKHEVNNRSEVQEVRILPAGTDDAPNFQLESPNGTS